MGHTPEEYGGSTTPTTEVIHIQMRAREVNGATMMGAQTENDCDAIEGGKHKGLIGEMISGDAMEVECASATPSPTESGTTTPALRISACPLRLTPFIPAANYGATKDGLVFRSAYPQDKNIGFLKLLDVRSVLCLVRTEPSDAYARWIDNSSIKRYRVDIAANKDGKVNTTWDSLSEALLIALDSANYPLYIHCNQGKHRTGCVIACLRKIQHWAIEDIIEEYQTYSGIKARPADMELIRAFDPEAVFEYAKRIDHLDQHPGIKRADSIIANIDGLADALSGKAPYCDDIDMSNASSGSTISDDGFLDDQMLKMSVVAGADTTPSSTTSRPGLQRTTVQHGDATGNSEAAAPILLDPALQQTEATASVMELDSDLVTPPAEPGKIMFSAL